MTVSFHCRLEIKLVVIVIVLSYTKRNKVTKFIGVGLSPCMFMLICYVISLKLI